MTYQNIPASDTSSSLGALLWLSPLLLDEDPGQPRQEFELDALAQLTQSVADQGVTVPLEVIPQANGRYRIVCGARRTRAALAAGLDAVPCIISPAHGALDIRRRQLLENVQRVDLSPLEQAQSLYSIWLLSQIDTCEQEQGDDGTTTSTMLSENPSPTAQMAALESRLCTLANVESVASYLGGGASVRVSWQTVLQSAGMGQLSEGARKKLLGILKLPAAVQDALSGMDVSGRTLRALSQQPEETALALVDQATAAAGDDGDVGAALRAALNAPHITSSDTTDPYDASDAAALVKLLPGDLGSSTNDGEYVPLLTDSGGTATKLVTDQVSPARGSTPPSSLAVWSHDDVLLLHGGLEACLKVVETVVGPRFSGEQRRALGVLWRELVERMEAAGISQDNQ